MSKINHEVSRFDVFEYEVDDSTFVQVINEAKIDRLCILRCYSNINVHSEEAEIHVNFTYAGKVIHLTETHIFAEVQELTDKAFEMLYSWLQTNVGHVEHANCKGAINLVFDINLDSLSRRHTDFLYRYHNLKELCDVYMDETTFRAFLSKYEEEAKMLWAHLQRRYKTLASKYGCKDHELKTVNIFFIYIHLSNI